MSASRRARGAPRALEHAEQAAFVELCAMRRAVHRELALLYAIPNGGARHKATAGRLKAEGVRAGVPDMHLPVPRNGYCGLWLEFKIRPNRPTEQQRAWISALRGQGHRVEIVYTADEAWRLVNEYLSGRLEVRR